MSFDYNPWQHIEIIEDDKEKIILHCHGCGGDKELKTDSISDAFTQARIHIETSHGRSKEDFEGWSIY